MIKKNSIYAWWLASRPKTLTGAASPILLSLSSAYHIYGSIDWTAALCCISFALLLQIDANLINDYFDCIRGVDTEQRLGPERSCSQGWITLPAMRMGIVITTLMACLTGLPLIAWGGWEAVLVGVVCVVFCFLYTTLFSRLAMGDILVILFFGIIPVGYTFFFQSPCPSITDIPLGIWCLALAQGLVTDCLLLVNNFRDRDTDAACGKITLVTIIGPNATLLLYGTIGVLSVTLSIIGLHAISNEWSIFRLIPLLFIPIHFLILRLMKKIYHGRELNRVLGMTAMSIFCFAIITSIALIL